MAKKAKKKSAKTQAPSGIRHDARTKAKAIELALKDKTVPEIHAKLKRPDGSGPAQKTIRAWLAAEGIEPPSGRRRSYDRKKILKDLRAKNSDGSSKYTRAQLQTKYGCTAKYLSTLATGKIAP